MNLYHGKESNIRSSEFYSRVKQHFNDVNFTKKKQKHSLKRALCYSLASCPDVVLLDEPFSPDIKEPLTFFL